MTDEEMIKQLKDAFMNSKPRTIYPIPVGKETYERMNKILEEEFKKHNEIIITKNKKK